MIRYFSKSDAKDMILISLCTRERQMLEMPYTYIRVTPFKLICRKLKVGKYGSHRYRA